MGYFHWALTASAHMAMAAFILDSGETWPTDSFIIVFEISSIPFTASLHRFYYLPNAHIHMTSLLCVPIRLSFVSFIPSLFFIFFSISLFLHAHQHAHANPRSKMKILTFHFPRKRGRENKEKGKGWISFSLQVERERERERERESIIRGAIGSDTDRILPLPYPYPHLTFGYGYGFGHYAVWKNDIRIRQNRIPDTDRILADQMRILIGCLLNTHESRYTSTSFIFPWHQGLLDTLYHYQVIHH